MKKSLNHKFKQRLILVFILIGIANSFSTDAQSKIDTLAIENIITRAMSDNNIVGSAVAIINSNGVIYKKGFGEAEKNGAKTSSKTVFNIGSLTKSFTALAILQLEDKNKLSLNDYVIDYLPNFRTKNKNLSNKITLFHLANHTSGFTTVQGNRSQVNNYSQNEALESAVTDYENVSLKFEPGITSQYSNANYQILGLIIERVTGQSYENYVIENILKPLKMTNSGFEYNTLWAMPHRYMFGIPIKYNNEVKTGINAQGGLYSNVEDMGNYLKSMLNQDSLLISKTGFTKIFEPSNAKKSSQGTLGWRYRSKNGNQKLKADVYWHVGNNPGFASVMFLIPQEDLGITILANTDGSPYGINNTSELIYGPINYILGIKGGTTPSYLGILSIVLWILPVVFILWIVKIFLDRFEKKRTLIRLIFSTFLVLALVYFLLKFIPNDIGGAGISSVYRFAPDVGLFIILTSIVAFIWMILIWFRYIIRK